MPPRLHRLSLFLTSVAFIVSTSNVCRAEVIYVDNRAGNDSFDGRVSIPAGGHTGPKKSISRALQVAHFGDTIDIRNTGRPYYESLVLFGAGHSGFPSQPFTINGNGAVINGSVPVPSDAWRDLGGGLWKFTPLHKGYYLLIRDDLPLPEIDVERDAPAVPRLENGQWCVWRGSIFYQSPATEYPPAQKFRFAMRGMGLTLYRIHDVDIRGLTFRNFRVDGVNAPDLCEGVILQDVASIHNGRCGLFVGGSADIIAVGCRFDANRIHQLLTRGLGHIELEHSESSEPPVKVE